jgi:diaminopimelate epimerase
MQFVKMEGCANDFIVTHLIKKPETIIHKVSRLCDRKKGIGADGIICVLPSKTADFSMRIFNADGSEAEMCGNGIRCFARYVASHKLSQKKNLSIETKAGVIKTQRTGDMVRVDMRPPILDAGHIPTTQKGGRVINKDIPVDGELFKITAVSMGNPHAVIFARTLTDELVLETGKTLERHPFFPRKVNVEFVRVLSGKEIQMRVFERGCGETMACGTGACAAVVAGVLNNKLQNTVLVHLLGGDLKIEWDGDPMHSVFMTGPAEFVFNGDVDL